jgi:hypothetical protein
MTVTQARFRGKPVELHNLYLQTIPHDEGVRVELVSVDVEGLSQRTIVKLITNGEDNAIVTITVETGLADGDNLPHDVITGRRIPSPTNPTKHNSDRNGPDDKDSVRQGPRVYILLPQCS